jgi:cell division protease FtsH
VGARPKGGGYGAKPFSEETARIVDAEVLKIINESHEQAKTLLRAHRKQLDALVAALLSRETLDEQEILDVTNLSPAPTLESRRVSIIGTLAPEDVQKADPA